MLFFLSIAFNILDLFRNKHGPMEKFPEDVVHAETILGGDLDILSREEFQETKKPSYAGLFGDSTKKTPASVKRGIKAFLYDYYINVIY